MNIIPLAVPTPFYVGDVNVYLIKEEPLTLIDTGPKTAEAFDVLRGRLQNCGVKMSEIQRILLTHAHEDHCGLAKQIRDETKTAEIYVHRWESGHLFGESAVSENRNLLTRAGVPELVFDEIQTVFKAVAPLTDAFDRSEFSELTDESEIEFSGGVLKVLHTPGHTPGSCSFFREANRTLIAGDTILKRITPNPIVAPDPFDAGKRFQSLAEYLVSLARLRAVSPTLVYGGHGEPIDDYEEIFHRYVRSIDERQKKIIRLVSKNIGVTAFEAARQLFPAAVGANVHQFLAISEAVAHLDYAAAENKIAVELKDGAEFYRSL